MDAMKAKLDMLMQDLEKIRKAMNEIDEQTAQLRNNRDQLLSKGLEIQGAVKVLQELLAAMEPKAE